MSETPPQHFESPVSWNAQGQPFSERFGDIYHTSSGAVKQVDHVFLKGCGLPVRWQNKEHFTILETGFGLGLNFLTTLLRWQQDPKRSHCLHYVSIEAFPTHVQDIEKALQNIPELQELGQAFRKLYPAVIEPCEEDDFHIWQMEFAQEGNSSKVMLTLLQGDVREVLPQLELSADAIFLDGFSPAKNPDMWGQDICNELARLCAPDACIATWCVAGQVRKHLACAGFSIQKVAGLPPKRNSLAGAYQPKVIQPHS